MTHFVACTKDITIEEITNLVMREAFCHHGLPNNNINDCSPQFISKIWMLLSTMLKVKQTLLRLSSTN